MIPKRSAASWKSRGLRPALWSSGRQRRRVCKWSSSGGIWLTVRSQRKRGRFQVCHWNDWPFGGHDGGPQLPDCTTVDCCILMEFVLSSCAVSLWISCLSFGQKSWRHSVGDTLHQPCLESLFTWPFIQLVALEGPWQIRQYQWANDSVSYKSASAICIFYMRTVSFLFCLGCLFMIQCHI